METASANGVLSAIPVVVCKGSRRRWKLKLGRMIKAEVGMVLESLVAN